MAQRIIILLPLFILIIHVNCQFYDLFQNFPPYLQNYPTQPEYSVFNQDFSHRRPVTDIRHDGRPTNTRPVLAVITNDKIYEENRTAKPKRKITSAETFNLDQTTTKPARKNNKNSSQRNTSKVNNKNEQLIANNRRHFYDDSANNVADYYTEKPHITTKRNYGTNRPNYAVTRPTVTSRLNYATTSRPNYENTRPHTTHNPLYNRPGVKPAVVDSNLPPITNKPATSRPFAVYPKPTDSSAIRYPAEPDTSPEIVVGPDEDRMSSAEKRRYINLAEKMCDKYKSLNVRKVEAIPLLPSPEPVQVNVSVCPPTTVPLVVGGKVVSIGEFPHMALLGWTKLQGGGYSWKCGGSLISDQFVLTAGHCASQEKDDSVVSGAPRVVQLGSSYLDDTGALVMRVIQVVRHPKYVQTRSYYDIALVKLVEPVTFSEVVKPACLGAPPGVGEPIIATGWGRTEFGGSQSLELRSVSVPIWDMEECKDVLGTSRKLPNGPSRDSQICAGEKNGGKDTCQGDSGGPAQIQDGCAWRVVAVTSLGRSCGAPNTPALYATLQRAFISAQIFGKTSNQNANSNTNQNSRPNNGNRDTIVFPTSRPNNNEQGNGNVNYNSRPNPSNFNQNSRPSQNTNNGNYNRREENVNANTNNNNRFGTSGNQNTNSHKQDESNNNQGSWNNPQNNDWNNNRRHNNGNSNPNYNDGSYHSWNANTKQDNHDNNRESGININQGNAGQSHAYDDDRGANDEYNTENNRRLRRPNHNSREDRNRRFETTTVTTKRPTFNDGSWWSNFNY